MTPKSQHVIIYSHGFGVRKTNRGLFSAVADTFTDAQNVLFDYNSINEESNTITVKPLNEQALKMRKIINIARTEYPGAVLDLVCHSQGCIVAGLVKPRGIRKVLMIAPPDDLSEATVVSQLGTRNGSSIDVAVRTRLPGSDGSTTVIHPEYWQSLAGIKPVKLYNKLSRFTKLVILNARQDEVLGKVSFEGIDPAISLVTLDGNHNFDVEADRKRILYILQKELSIST